MRTAAHGLFTLGLLVAAGAWLATTSDELGVGPAALAVGIHDPVRAGEPTPVNFRQLLRRDAIHPIYDPSFRTTDFTDWPDEAIVIGVEHNGEAKAYPVTFLNRREMVDDWIGGTPVLVSW